MIAPKASCARGSFSRDRPVYAWDNHSRLMLLLCYSMGRMDRKKIIINKKPIINYYILHVQFKKMNSTSYIYIYMLIKRTTGLGIQCALKLHNQF